MNRSSFMHSSIVRTQLIFIISFRLPFHFHQSIRFRCAHTHLLGLRRCLCTYGGPLFHKKSAATRPFCPGVIFVLFLYAHAAIMQAKYENKLLRVALGIVLVWSHEMREEEKKKKRIGSNCRITGCPHKLASFGRLKRIAAN